MIIRNLIAMSNSQASTANLKKQVLAKHRRRAKGSPKLSTIAIYASLFVLIIAIVSVGYRSPQQATSIASAQTVNSSSSQTSVDQVVATNLAANLAETANLPVATNVANLSVSLASASQLVQSQSSSSVISKPQIIQPSAESRAIISYVTKAGDTTDSVAAIYGVSNDTIKWANNITADSINPGTTLQVLPIDGVLYTVKAGDTAQSIAAKYGVDQTRLVTYNDLDLSGLAPDSKIILPSGVLPTTERPGYVAPRTYNSGYSSGYGSISASMAQASAGNRYAYGYCTWYVFNRRAEMGRPIGSYWGNASSWAYSASAAGFLVNHTPERGAIIQNGGGAGHVAVVESVDPNTGDITVSEMNNSAYGGWGVKDTHGITAGQAASYNFIH